MQLPAEAAKAEERGLFRGALDALNDPIFAAIKDKQKDEARRKRPSAADSKIEVDLSMQRLRTIPALSVKDDDVEGLDLNGNFISSIEANAFASLRLAKLNLGSNDLVQAPSVASLPLLRELYLNSNRLTSLSSDFQTLSHLVVLDLRKNKLDSFDLAVLAGSRYSLHKLSLSCNRLVSFKTPEGVVFDQLSFLGLFGNRLSAYRPVVDGLSSGCPQLTKLLLSGNGYTATAEYREYVLRQLGSVQWLDWQFVLPDERQRLEAGGARKRKAEEDILPATDGK